MKFTGKIKYIEYFRYYENDFCPGSLGVKSYFAENHEIEINYRGIYDYKTIEYIKRQSRPFLNPKGQK